MTDPRYVQLVRSAIDSSISGLSFDARAVFVDLLMRVDYRTCRYVTTLTDYSAFLGVPRKRITAAMRELAGAGLVESSFPKGHDGDVVVPVDIYEQCVRTRTIRASQVPHTRHTRADEHKRPGLTPRQTSDVEDVQTSDPVARFQTIAAAWSRATGRQVSEDDLSRCITYSRTDCITIGADHRLIIDETLGKVEAQEPKTISDICGYFRASVKQNASEAMGLAS